MEHEVISTFQTLIILTISYLMGSIPFGLLLGFIKGKDIRKAGSGNIGATNATRSLGLKLGILTLFLDGIKGILPAILFYKITPDLKVATFFMAFMGHVFSIFLKFKGGKGVATFFFTTTMIHPTMAIVFATSWIATFLISKYASLASMVAFITSTTYWPIKTSSTICSNSYSQLVLTYCLLATAIMLIKHRQNIVRILNKTEPKINKKKK
jgi:glycerol-3-phosphate acyltransferase PlsY